MTRRFNAVAMAVLGMMGGSVGRRFSAGVASEAKSNLIKSAMQKRSEVKLRKFIVKGIEVEARSYKDAIKILKHRGQL